MAPTVAYLFGIPMPRNAEGAIRFVALDDPDLHLTLRQKAEAECARATLRQSLTRLGRPQNIAYCAVYLASDEAEYVTGSVFTIDGGMDAKGMFNIPGTQGV